MAATVVTVDPLYSEPADVASVVELAHRHGRYRVYAEQESDRVDHALGRGLHPRHDSVLHYLRSGGARGHGADLEVAAARTSYFREEYAYGASEHVIGASGFLGLEVLAEAARAVHGLPLVEPAIVFANLMVPGQELAVHTDVPEFRGLDRKKVPEWFLVVMHHSGLFERWHLPIATGVSYFADSAGGGFRAWPDGATGDPVVYPVRTNTALVLDTDTVFHAVDPVGTGTEAPAVRPGSTLSHDGDGWVLADGTGVATGRYEWRDLRFSVSWKGYCFADEADRHRWQTQSDELSADAAIDTLVADLGVRGQVPPDVERNADLGLILIDTYVRFPDNTRVC